MYPTDTILKFGFPAGRVSGAKLRINFLFAVVTVALIWRFNDFEFGLLASGILLLSVLMHELAHLVVARSTAGEMDELDLWPLGGLSEPFGRGYWRDHMQTMLAGPLVNALLAASCLLKLTPEQVYPLLNPFAPFQPAGETVSAVVVCQMVFSANLILVAANLIPITPFDTGVLLRTYLTTRFSEAESRDVMVRLGLVFGTLGLLTGFILDISSVTALSAVIVVFHFHESLRWIETDSQSDFFEYDFDERESNMSWPHDSENDISIDGDIDEHTHDEILDRWRTQREQERLELEREERQREERQLDEILQKLHVHGRESLSTNEIHLLNRVSDRYRNREQHH